MSGKAEKRGLLDCPQRVIPIVSGMDVAMIGNEKRVYRTLTPANGVINSIILFALGVWLTFAI